MKNPATLRAERALQQESDAVEKDVRRRVWEDRAKNVQWTTSADYRWLPAPILPHEERSAATSRTLAESASKMAVPAKTHLAIFRYANALSGIMHTLYDDERIAQFMAAHAQQLPKALLEALLALPMQTHARRVLAEGRPAMAMQNHRYLLRQLAQWNFSAPRTLVEQLQKAHFERALGDVPKASPAILSLLDSLEALENADTNALLDGMNAILGDYFHLAVFRDAQKTEATNAPRTVSPEKSQKEPSLLSEEAVLEEMLVGAAEFTSLAQLEEHKGKQRAKKPLFPKRIAKSEQARRAFIKRHFGRPLLTPEEAWQLRMKTATGVHQNSIPYLTSGLSFAQMSSFRKEQREKVAEQNRAYLEAHRHTVRRAERVLRRRLEQVLHAEEEDSPAFQEHGKLVGGRVWRVFALRDNRVFLHDAHDAPRRLIVDVLLDASASQEPRHASVATQGFLLAETLESIGIPFRATTFQSQQGFTILTRLHDYTDHNRADALLRYFPDGANRDGYALRLIGETLQKKPGCRNVLIVLSDGKPYDQRIALNNESFQQFQQYEEDFAILDTAREVERLRRQGIAVFGLFTGEEKDLRAAQRIYGTGFAYIRTPERFAALVAQVLEEELERG